MNDNQSVVRSYSAPQDHGRMQMPPPSPSLRALVQSGDSFQHPMQQQQQQQQRYYQQHEQHHSQLPMPSLSGNYQQHQMPPQQHSLNRHQQLRLHQQQQQAARTNQLSQQGQSHYQDHHQNSCISLHDIHQNNAQANNMTPRSGYGEQKIFLQDTRPIPIPPQMGFCNNQSTDRSAPNNHNKQNIAFAPEEFQLDFNPNVEDIHFNPIEPTHLAPKCHGSTVGALRFDTNRSSPQRSPVKYYKSRKDSFRRHEQEADVANHLVDKIFSENNLSSREFVSFKGKNNSSTRSIMSLSIDGTDPNSLGQLFNTSLRISNHGSKHTKKLVGDFDTSEKGMRSIFEMSVHSLGDQFSEFGDSYAFRMAESQASMSVGNVFDDSFK